MQSNLGFVYHTGEKGSFFGDFGGFCPVQGFGQVKKGQSIQHWYFRSRYEEWLLAVGEADEDGYVPCDKTIWEISGDLTDSDRYAAGYLGPEAVVELLHQAFRDYFAST